MGPAPLSSRALSLVAMVGAAPTTSALSARHSAVELHRHK